MIGPYFISKVQLVGHEFLEPMMVEGVTIVGQCKELPDRPQPLIEHVTLRGSSDLAQVA